MRIASGQNTKPKSMYIITNKNELFEYYDDRAHAGYQLLYHSDEISLRVHAYAYSDSLPAWASLPGQLNGIYLVHRRQGSGLVSYPVGSNRREDWGPHVEARLDPTKYEHPMLGEIPTKYREALKDAIKKLTSSPVKGHELLQSKLEEAGQRL